MRFAEDASFNPQPCRPLGINALAAREAAALAEQFLKIARDENLDTTARDSSPRSAPALRARGLPGHGRDCASTAARCVARSCTDGEGVLARESVVNAPLLVASEVREIAMRGDVETLLTLATAIKRRVATRTCFPRRSTTRPKSLSTPRSAASSRSGRRASTISSCAATVRRCAARTGRRAARARSRSPGHCPLKNWDTPSSNGSCGSISSPMVSGIRAAAAQRRTIASMLIEQICHRRDELSRDQGTRRLAGGEVVALARATRAARRLRAGAPRTAERPRVQNHLCRKRAADDRRAHSGSLRRRTAICASRAAASRSSFRCSRRIIGPFRSRRTSRTFGRSRTRRSNRSCSGNIRSTSGGEVGALRGNSFPHEGRERRDIRHGVRVREIENLGERAVFPNPRVAIVGADLRRIAPSVNRDERRI